MKKESLREAIAREEAQLAEIVHRQVGALPEPMLREVVEQFLEVVNESESD